MFERLLRQLHSRTNKRTALLNAIPLGGENVTSVERSHVTNYSLTIL